MCFLQPVIERALSIFGSFTDRAQVELLQARKALTPHVFDLICSGQTDEMAARGIGVDLS